MADLVHVRGEQVRGAVMFNEIRDCGFLKVPLD
jgi:hypothetical protein